ncbi:MAG: ABC transporter substrate-binding protein [Sumerlaeia bacterium]
MRKREASRIFWSAVAAVLWLSLATVARAATTETLRIISCAPNGTQMLYALGLGDQVIGVSEYCQFPPEAQNKPKYGNLFEPNLEAMLAARPSAVVATPTNHKVIEFFQRRSGTQVVVLESCDTIAEIHATIQALGDALGREVQARALVEADRAALAEMAAANAPGEERPRVLFVVGRDRGSLRNLYAAGSGTYIAELIEAAGGTNAAGPDDGLWPTYSREGLIGLRPGIIVEIADADTTETRQELRRAWSRLPMLPAVRDSRLELLTDRRVLIPGPYLARDAEALRGVIGRRGADSETPPSLGE